MKNTVSVKKCKNHRIFTAVFSVCMMGIMAFVTAFIGIKGIIPSIPLLLILLPMNLYYFTWRIDLEPNAIVHRLFFREVKRYTYSELQDVIILFLDKMVRKPFYRRINILHRLRRKKQYYTAFLGGHAAMPPCRLLAA